MFDNYAFTSPTILANEELGQRGYQQFNGNSGSGVILPSTGTTQNGNNEFDFQWNKTETTISQHNSNITLNQSEVGIHEAKTYFNERVVQ